MGCITKHYLNRETMLGVWKIEEDLPALLEMMDMGPEDKKRYAMFRSTSRKMEFLSVRALLAEMLDRNARIVYNKNNKPFLKDGSHFISISHSSKLTAIILSTNERVGIDLEYMRVNINAFASRFLNKREKVTRRWADRTYHLYIHWCAKETIYKICDKEGINIVNDITIEPFDVKESGEIRGYVKNERIDDQFTLYYSKYDNYTIVWTKKKHES
ncbi:MAG: 4'-phosphopantetheinyl transferase superfamily protein [Bacteroidales bacterium]|nr:4'-phosphopantetheinyl transferase superfamily protein [Bacteroidales bacterium]MDT8374045.1 4'-phosphopantetheinyl transferase superfamily protein [Bacteroidales bacterium]